MSRTIKHPPEIVDEACRLWNARVPTDEIAAAIGIRFKQVAGIIACARANGVDVLPARDRYQPRVNMDDAQAADFTLRWNAGEAGEELARRFGIRPTQVSALPTALRARGFKLIGRDARMKLQGYGKANTVARPSARFTLPNGAKGRTWADTKAEAEAEAARIVASFARTPPCRLVVDNAPDDEDRPQTVADMFPLRVRRSVCPYFTDRGS